MIRFEESNNAQLIAQMNRPVQELHARLYPEYFKPYDVEVITGAMQKLFDVKGAKAIIAYSDNTAAGYLLYFMREQAENAFQYGLKTLHIDQMSVDEPFLHQGIGTALLQHVLLLAQQAEVHRIDLNTWTTNESALHFFRKNGFHTFNERLQLVLENR